MEQGSQPTHTQETDPHLGAAGPTDHISTQEPDEPERGPWRRCVATRVQGERRAMLRFVVSPQGLIVPDLAARLPGRGIWLSARADVINNPRTRQAFARAARMRVDVPDDLVLQVQNGLRLRIADLIGFARRAGQAVAGYQKAHEWLVAGRAALVVQALDGSAEERSRFIGGNVAVPVVTPLPACTLGMIFGRETAVHIAIGAGRLAGLIQVDTARLDGVVGKMGSGGAMAPARDESLDEE